jgi:predicted DCC family thiol-disulfide oxidoreductase YuxK
MPETNPKPIVIFDGVCGLCNRFVALSLKNDTRGELIFVPNRSEFGLHLCKQLGVLAESDQTIIVAQRCSHLHSRPPAMAVQLRTMATSDSAPRTRSGLPLRCDVASSRAAKPRRVRDTPS